MVENAALAVEGGAVSMPPCPFLSVQLSKTVTRCFATRIEHSAATDESDRHKERVVILGSGWGGYTLSRKLSPKIYSPIIISPRSYFVFTPLLTDAASGSLDFSNIVEPVRDPRAKVDFIQAAARAVDLKKKTILCEATVVKSGVTETPRTDEERQFEEGSLKPAPQRKWEEGETFEVPYDKLVIAVGTVSRTFGTPGVRENAMFFKDIGDAKRVKRRMRECFELAVLPTTTPEMQRWLLHFAIVGAGPTGTELAASLRDFIYSDMMKIYPTLKGIPQISLYDIAPSVLSMFDESLSRYAMETMKSEGIDIKTSHHVQGLRWGPPGAEPPYEMDPKRCLTLDTKEEGEVGVGLCVWVTGNAMTNFVTQSLGSIDAFPTESASLRDAPSANLPWHYKKAPKTGALLVDGHLRVLRGWVTALHEDVVEVGRAGVAGASVEFGHLVLLLGLLQVDGAAEDIHLLAFLGVVGDVGVGRQGNLDELAGLGGLAAVVIGAARGLLLAEDGALDGLGCEFAVGVAIGEGAEIVVGLTPVLAIHLDDAATIQGLVGQRPLAVAARIAATTVEAFERR